MSVTLTKEERETLAREAGGHIVNASDGYCRACAFQAAVEHIVADRLARVEALADEWEGAADNTETDDRDYENGVRLTLRECVRDLRAALRADPSEAPAQPWAGPVAALREGRVRPGLPARPDPDSSEAPA